ncbi:epoxide hydrolase family protein [Amycolatopsis anabasis]|uniref:epoxide hydrolase family protein n=1 Tax=Amycolatopsis anabasis TaxID=1840409 RepID=UPI00131B17CE|nr:epoxide hydrolase family protein [Amycolatopsis anabasis]
MEPFTLHVPDSVLSDLRDRLVATRWPGAFPEPGWGYGTDAAYLRELVEYWLSSFDWRAQEERLNGLSHHRVTVDGTGVHFVWERGDGPNPLPLILTHGWPSTFAELERVIPLLTHPEDPADAFDVVVPSLPGFGFSGKPAEPGIFNSAGIARLWTSLMRDHLGYERFAAAGGDLGSYVTSRLGMHHAENVVGIHIDPIALVERPLVDPAEGTDEEKAFYAGLLAWVEEEGAYSRFQATKPSTLTFGLNDSPAGLASYIVEKFRAWSDCGGDVERRFGKDQLLTTVTLYWATGTIGSSFLPYYDAKHHAPADPTFVEVPTAVALWPGDPIMSNPFPPRSYAERGFNVRRWTEMPCGGHFYASEEPELLAQDLREFFRPLR